MDSSSFNRVRPEWRDFCVDYSKWEHMINDNAHERDAKDEKDDDLVNEDIPKSISNEMYRVSRAYHARLAALQEIVKATEAETETVAESGIELTIMDEEAQASYSRILKDAEELQFICEYNKNALSKIMKHFDTVNGRSEHETFERSLKVQAFYRHDELNQILGTVRTQLRTQASTAISLGEGEEKTWARPATKFTVKPWWALIAIILLIVLCFVPIFEDENIRARRCLAMLAGVMVMWVSEALPFYVTALCIPFLTVIMQIFDQPADEAAKAVFSHMFDHTTMLVLGGFAMSAAFSKYGFELIVISFMQRTMGSQPRLFLLSFMFVGWFFSMWISNVAAPVLCTAVILPILHTLPPDSKFAKATVVGLALACNIGGMLSPISSPQNAVALGLLDNDPNAEKISFSQWLEVSIPFCLILLVASWAFLLVVIRPDDVEEIPPIKCRSKKFGNSEWIIMATCFVTVLLWCTLQLTKSIFGDMGTIALIPLVTFLTTGILTTHDFNSFSWNLIMLIAGGNVLGAAIKESHLLDIVAGAVVPGLQHLSTWSCVMAVSAFCLGITTFVSHTVGAIILTPMIITIGEATGNTQMLVMAATLMYSGAMALPMSSFPNMNALMVEDVNGNPYVRAVDFLIFGIPFSAMVLIVMAGVGYFLMEAVF